MRLQAMQIRVLLGKGGETIKQICGEPLTAINDVGCKLPTGEPRTSHFLFSRKNG